MEQYGKMKEPRRHIDREARRGNDTGPQGYFESINGKHVEAHLTTGEVLSGIMESNSYNKFDVKIENEEETYLVRKDVIAFIKISFGQKIKGS